MTKQIARTSSHWSDQKLARASTEKFTAKEDFLRDAARSRLRYLGGEYEHIEVLKEKYKKGESAIKEAVARAAVWKKGVAEGIFS